MVKLKKPTDRPDKTDKPVPNNPNKPVPNNPIKPIIVRGKATIEVDDGFPTIYYTRGYRHLQKAQILVLTEVINPELIRDLRRRFELVTFEKESSGMTRIRILYSLAKKTMLRNVFQRLEAASKAKAREKKEFA